MQERIFSGYLTRNVVQLIAYQGITVEDFCATAGFDPVVLTTPNQRIARSLHSMVWDEAVRRTGNETLGLQVGDTFCPGHYGVAGYVLLHSATLAEAFQKFICYNELFSQEVAVNLSESNGMAFLDCTPIGKLDREPHLLQNSARHDTESLFALLLKTTKKLTGKPLHLSAAWFCHAPPDNLTDYDRIFQTDLRFSMPVNRLIFDANCLQRPIPSSNAMLLAQFEQQAEALLATMNHTGLYQRKVVEAIGHQFTEHQLQGELPTIDAIATQLAMSTRQLQRELKAEGTSFQKLLDDTRQDLALRYLKNPTVPLHDIASLLGFSGTSAFNRAFKRWTGQTPGSYRNDARCISHWR